MAETSIETQGAALLRYLSVSCAASQVPVRVEDEATLLELARRLRDQ